jgi:hypothetical protein
VTAAHGERNAATIVDLADRTAGRDARTLVANPFDAHPSRSLHAEIGEMLADAVRRTYQPAAR